MIELLWPSTLPWPCHDCTLFVVCCAALSVRRFLRFCGLVSLCRSLLCLLSLAVTWAPDVSHDAVNGNTTVHGKSTQAPPKRPWLLQASGPWLVLSGNVQEVGGCWPAEPFMIHNNICHLSLSVSWAFHENHFSQSARASFARAWRKPPIEDE